MRHNYETLFDTFKPTIAVIDAVLKADRKDKTNSLF